MTVHRVRSVAAAVGISVAFTGVSIVPCGCSYDEKTKRLQVDPVEFGAWLQHTLQMVPRGGEAISRDEALVVAIDATSNDPTVEPPAMATAWETPKKSEYDFYTCDGQEIWCAAFFARTQLVTDAIGASVKEWVENHLLRDRSARWDGTTYRVSLPTDGSVVFIAMYLDRTNGQAGWVAVQSRGGLRTLTNNGARSTVGPNGALSFGWNVTDSRELTVTVMGGGPAEGGRQWIKYAFD